MELNLSRSVEINPPADPADGVDTPALDIVRGPDRTDTNWARVRSTAAAIAGLAVIALGVVAVVNGPDDDGFEVDAGRSSTTLSDPDQDDLAVAELPEVTELAEAGGDQRPDTPDDDTAVDDTADDDTADDGAVDDGAADDGAADDGAEPSTTESSTTETTPASSIAPAGEEQATAPVAPPAIVDEFTSPGQPRTRTTGRRTAGGTVSVPPYVTLSIPRGQRPSVPAPAPTDSPATDPIVTQPSPTQPSETQPSATQPATQPTSPATQSPPTAAPTTAAPSTAAPTTAAPTTAAPTTAAPLPPPGSAGNVGWNGGGGIGGANCSVQVDPGTPINSAISSAGNGATVCVSASNRGGEKVRVSTPGVRLVATGSVTIGEVIIDADGVKLEGFEIANGVEGVEVLADNVLVRNNYIHDTSSGGLVCGNSRATVCNGIVVANNTVIRNVGVSVEVWGSNVLIERNDIRDPLYVRRDTDTLRVMAGQNQTIRGNYMEIPNINARNADPHPDCIMMFDSDAAQFKDWVTNNDVLIESNICVNDSAHNCFILSGRRQHRSGNFVIRNNVCDHAGANAFFIEDLTNVELSNNLCTGRITKNCIAFVGRVNNAVSQNNLFAGSGKLHQINIPSAVSWTDRSNFQGDPQYADPSNSNPWYRYRPGAGSPVRDAGSGSSLGSSDILGQARVQGPAPDIGPYES